MLRLSKKWWLGRQFMKLIFKVDLQPILDESGQFDFYLLTGIGQRKKDKIGVEPAEVKDLPTTIEALTKIFKDGREKYGDRAWSSMIVKRLEDACGEDLRASGYPDELVDDTPRRKGYEVIPNNIK